MKRIGNIFDRVISLENLRLADEKARKGKGRTYGVRVHDKNREANLQALHEQLKNGTFKTSKYHTFTIHEPKEREIFRLPYYPDRILHHAIMNVLEPIWVSVFNKNTYSCIKNRGIHKCAKDLKQALKQDPDGTRYCLKMDIRKFYPSISHNVLKRVVRRKIKDNRLLALLDEIIDSVNDNTPKGLPVRNFVSTLDGHIQVCSHGTVDVVCDTKGVPIGNYLSQYFANLVLAYFDHWLKEKKRVKYYWRYADDIVILASTKAELHELLHEIRAYLRDNLQLTVKRNYQVFPVDKRGIDFLGYVFYHTHTRLRKTIKQNLCRRVAKMNKRKVAPKKEVYKQQICSWWGWCKHCNAINLMNKLSKSFPYEITFNRSKRAL